MLIEFLAVIAAGFGGAGVALILRQLSARRLPSWLVPFSAAAGMLGMVIYLEYSWADRFEAGLPTTWWWSAGTKTAPGTAVDLCCASDDAHHDRRQQNPENQQSEP